MIFNLKLNQIFKMLEENKKSSDILFLGKYEVDSRDIEIARMSAKLIKEVNVDRQINKIDKYTRGNKQDQIDFMCALSQNHFSKRLYNRYNESNKHIKVKSPSIASYFVQKKEQDFQISYQNTNINFDLKSQYFQSSTSSLNINKESHERFLKTDIDFYVAAIFRNKDKNYSDFEDVDSIYYFLVPKNYVHEKSELVITKAPYYAMHISKFIEKIA